jgi:hypothetical protein
MTDDKLTAALARYRAMAGQVKDLPADAARRAKADQRRYGARYRPQRGKRLAEPLCMIRFLVDVCGLSLREASHAVRTELQKDPKQPWEPDGETVEETAEKLRRAVGDTLDAVALARFYAWVSFQPDGWTDVRDRLVSKAAEEGVQSRQEAAE